MKFGYTIIYVKDVKASLNFFDSAFGIKTRFFHESGYGELETGATTLAFASHELGASNLPDGYISTALLNKPLGIEIALVTDSVEKAHEKAVKAGALSIKNPMEKPWGKSSPMFDVLRER